MTLLLSWCAAHIFLADQQHRCLWSAVTRATLSHSVATYTVFAARDTLQGVSGGDCVRGGAGGWDGVPL